MFYIRIIIRLIVYTAVATEFLTYFDIELKVTGVLLTAAVLFIHAYNTEQWIGKGY